MKRIFLCLTLVCLTATLFVLTATAQRPAATTLEDFDIRAGLSQTPVLRRNTSLTASDRIRNELPSAQIHWSPSTGMPDRVWSVSEKLSAPSPLDAADAARQFLRSNSDLFSLEDGAVDRLSISRRYQTSHNGITHVTFQQNVDGIDIFRAELTVHLDRENAVIASSGDLVPAAAGSLNMTRPSLDAGTAVLRARIEAGADGAAIAPDTLRTRLVYFPFAQDELRLAWEFILEMRETPDVYLMLIDAERGSLLYRYNLTRYDENPLKPHGQVFTKESPRPNLPFSTTTPSEVAREDVLFHAAPFNGSTIFQLSNPHYDWWAGASAASLISNNANTYLDRDGNPNQPDLPLLAAADGNYSFPLDLTLNPTTPDSQKAAQVNLFYWVNRYHDILYSFGFDEAAGNFQSSNFGLGGQGNDAIRAEVQDGSGTNNANFSALPDGQFGRVQMYLFTGSPDRDSSFDQMVVLHELTHGLSNRLIGNATGLGGTQGRGMGEGWSDWVALTLLATEGDDPDGTYPAGQFSTNNFQRGIRRFPYSTNIAVYPLTYKDVAINPEVHAIGEIWCNTLWEMRALLVKQYGFREGQRQAIQLVVDGMTLTPIVPSFLDARNAILLADRINNGGTNQCLIWQAFAKRGAGYLAVSADSNDIAPIENFASAPYCNPTASLSLDKKDYIEGELIRASLADQNPPAGAINVQFSSSVTGDHESLSLSADGSIKGVFNGLIKLAQGSAVAGDGILQGSVEKSDEITVSYEDPSGSGGTPVHVTASASITREKVVFEDNVESGNQGWIRTGTWAITTSRSSSPSHSWTDSPTVNYANLTNSSITSPRFDLTGLTDVTLTFAYSGALEDRFDMGAIEYSTDDGQSWARQFTLFSASAQFVQARVNLPGLAGQARARIRFRLITDAGVTADGLYIDDMRLIARSASAALIPPGSEPVPVISAVSPAFGSPAGGTKVLITGMNFTEDETTSVTFDGVAASSVRVLGGSSLEAFSPPHAAGAVTVRVTNLHGSSAVVGAYTYYVPGSGTGSPTLTSIFPTSGTSRGGTVVTLIGSGFTPETKVSFGTTTTVTTFINSSTLRSVTPGSIFSPANVTVSNGTLQSTLVGAFKYVATSPPTVEIISPDGGESFFSKNVTTIRWRSSDDGAVVRHRITLIVDSGTNQPFEIASDIPGSEQSFTWTVPMVTQNSNYRITVTATDNEGIQASDTSSSSFSVVRRWALYQNLQTPLSFLQSATDGKFIYAFGGRTSSTASSAIPIMWRLDTSAPSPTWVIGDFAPLPTALFSGEACVLKGKIYLPGGVNAQNAVTGTHYAYDIASNTWTTRAQQTPSANAYSVVADESKGVFYMTGGSRTGAPSAIVKSYDPESNLWTDLPPMSTARRGHESVMIEGKLYVVGGEGATGNLGSGEVYDFTSRTWSPIATLNRPRAYATNVLTRSTSGNPLWLVVSGQNTSTGEMAPSEVYDVQANRWTVLDDSFGLSLPRFGLTGVTVGENFYALGGSSSATLTSSLSERLRVDTTIPVPASVTPIVAVPDPQVAVANAPLRFTVSANDFGGSMPASITATGLPAGAQFTTTTLSNNNVVGTFVWIPPSASSGQTFNVTFTATGEGLSDSKAVVIRVVEASKLTVVSAANYKGERLAADSMVAAFGTNLAVRTVQNDVLPLPIDLAGTKVTVSGVPAPLFFVSAGQINFAIPAAVEPGPATIIASNPNGSYALGVVEIVPSAPAIFSADSSGTGDAAAQATPDGITYQNSPFDVTVGGKPNVLVMYGTGIRHAIAADPNDGNGVAEACNVTIGGLPATVLYAGAQGVFFGLDQMNVILPEGLAGSGPRRVEIVVSVNGVEANRVTIALK